MAITPMVLSTSVTALIKLEQKPEETPHYSASSILYIGSLFAVYVYMDINSFLYVAVSDYSRCKN